MRLEHGNGANGDMVQAQLIPGFIKASVKHQTCSTFVWAFKGAHGNAATSAKLSLVQRSR